MIWDVSTKENQHKQINIHLASQCDKKIGLLTSYPGQGSFKDMMFSVIYKVYII